MERLAVEHSNDPTFLPCTRILVEQHRWQVISIQLPGLGGPLQGGCRRLRETYIGEAYRRPDMLGVLLHTCKVIAKCTTYNVRIIPPRDQLLLNVRGCWLKYCAGNRSIPYLSLQLTTQMGGRPCIAIQYAYGKAMYKYS